MKSIVLTLIILLFYIFCSPQKKSETAFNTKNSNHKTQNEFKTYFDDCGVEGPIVIFDKKNEERILSDTLSINTQNLPASTFLFNAIDHIPIVVNNLEKIKTIFKTQLNFTVKEGKTHEGIKNCFVKFQDGTYLEFIEPLDNSHSIGKYYASFLKTRQGCTSMGISIKNTDLTKKMLAEKNIPFSTDSNKIWQTTEPENSELFFIEYADKNWKENPKNTTHLNTATSLNSTYIVSDDIHNDQKKYKHLGFVEIGNGEFLETPYKLFKIGQSNLYLLDNKKSSKMNKLLDLKKLQGICGFEIKVNSLKTFNKQIKINNNIKYENNKTQIYFKDYNIFIIITELKY